MRDVTGDAGAPMSVWKRTYLGVQVASLRQLDRGLRQEEAFQLSVAQQTSHEITKASGTMGRYLRELPSADVDVLDYGCGWGGETLWLARQVRSVIGFDVEDSSVSQARAAARDEGISNCSFLSSQDGRIPLDAASVDAVFSTDTFEHVMDLDRAFSEIYRVLRPGGLLVTGFGPLFYSPFGYHLQWVCQVPWAHLVFGLKPIIELRNQTAGTVLKANRWEDTGLNGRVFGEFKSSAAGAGFELLRFDMIPVRGILWLARLPVLGKLFVLGIYCVVRKPLGDQGSVSQSQLT
jgi:SAM-dependent methyltransferase